MQIKIGHGYDVHKFGGEGPITICGIQIDYEQGLIAHSDGDVALHALCDALLGALALGDIGHHFPDNDDAYKNADSLLLLKHVYKEVTQRGFKLGNADITILAQAPKMAPHINDMRAKIAVALDVDTTCVSVKATTTEGLGFVGEKQGIACHANVLVVASK
jgi:2-C-methyl-D-erythritol 2,4-cyclodiphosphate synthase